MLHVLLTLSLRLLTSLLVLLLPAVGDVLLLPADGYALVLPAVGFALSLLFIISLLPLGMFFWFTWASDIPFHRIFMQKKFREKKNCSSITL